MKNFKVWLSLFTLILLTIAGVMLYVIKSRVVSSQKMTECETDSKLISDALAKPNIWNLTVLKPEENQTMTGIPVFVPLQNSSLLVGYKSDLIEFKRMTSKTGTPKAPVIDGKINEFVLPVMKKQGYELVITKDSADYVKNLPAIDLQNSTYLQYIFQKNNQILSLELNLNEQDAATVSILCDKNISEEQRMYEQLSTNPKLSDNNNYSIDIWGYKDNAFNLNVIQKGSQSGSNVYTALINNKWINLYEGQETPQCKQLENYKVGLGFDCFDTVSNTQRTVTY